MTQLHCFPGSVHFSSCDVQDDPRTRLFSAKKSKPTSFESDPHRLETQQLRPTNGALAQLVARQIPVSFKGALEKMLDS